MTVSDRAGPARSRGTHVGLDLAVAATLVLLIGVAVLPSAALAQAQATAPASEEGAASQKASHGYQPSQTCRTCHTEIARQYDDSMHAQSFRNPVVQALYYRELLPRAAQDPALLAEAKGCLACHAPIAAVLGGEAAVHGEIDPAMADVTCDFCHTIRGYDGDQPGNGNYRSLPGPLKLGPFEHKNDWHHGYSALHGQSEFCAICHRRTNRYGLEVIATFSEWQASRYAQEGIQCQDCHMSVDGFLKTGRARYAAGKAAYMTLGSAPDRARLFTHRFPGAHSGAQVAGALSLDMQLAGDTAAPGDRLPIDVLVDNSSAGHKMPSGTVELRFLLLVVTGHTAQGSFPIVPVTFLGSEVYAGALARRLGPLPLDPEDVAGARLYRAIYLDAAGNETFATYEAAHLGFDNRIDAGEIRHERYELRVPNARGPMTIEARLYYVPYPATYAERLQLPPPALIEIACVDEPLTVR